MSAVGALAGPLRSSAIWSKTKSTNACAVASSGS